MNAFGQVGFGFGERDFIEPFLFRLAKINGHLFYCRRDYEQVGFNAARQQRGCVILIDDCRNAFVIAVSRIDDWDAAAAHCNGDDACGKQSLNRFEFHDFLGQRRSHNPPPSAAGIFND